VDEQPAGVDKVQRFHARPKLNECRVQLVWLPMSGSKCDWRGWGAWSVRAAEKRFTS